MGLEAAPGVEDVAAIAERAGEVGDEAPGVDDIALRAQVITVLVCALYRKAAGPVAEKPS